MLVSTCPFDTGNVLYAKPQELGGSSYSVTGVNQTCEQSQILHPDQTSSQVGYYCLICETEKICWRWYAKRVAWIPDEIKDELWKKLKRDKKSNQWGNSNTPVAEMRFSQQECKGLQNTKKITSNNTHRYWRKYHPDKISSSGNEEPHWKA